MKRSLLTLLFAAFISGNSFSQCTTTNATSCVCPPGGGTNCDLLPDVKVSVDALQSGYTVYTQSGNAASGSQGSNDGRLRLTGTTPNIGYGPLETRSINKWLCGTDTLFSDPGTLCPDGRVPKRFVVQRIYHKNGNAMSYTDVPCGTMTYHPSHGHMHVDNWGIYTLRLLNPNDPDPTHWSIVGTGTKLAFCLLDIGSCDNGSGIYCRDDNNVPKLSNQIPNYTIGAGGYGCSSTLQGISNGWYDSYSSGLDGMWIDVPPGTCNGTYYIVVQLDPNQNMTELNENNNVVAVPITISNQSAAGSPVTKISANKPGTILTGDNITLTATAGSSYLWAPGGATTQSITVSAAGSYTCAVTNYCGTATSAPFVVTVLPAANAPSTTGAARCGTGTVNLTASNGGTGTMKWYSSAVATIPLTTGTSYTTSSISTTTTYYVENEVTTTGATTHVGPVDNTIGSGAYQTTTPSTTWYSQFDAVSDLTLVSVKVFASVAGNRTFILQDRASTQLKSQTINVPSTGANVITLNWFVPAGPGYKLMVSGTPNLYYNTSGVSYPYSAPGICNIFGSYSGHTNYTFFYDMVVKSPDLVAKSGRIPVVATINPVPSVSFTGLNSSYPSNSSAVTLTGSPAGGTFSGPGMNSNQFNPATAGVGGPYSIVYSYTNAQGCTGTQTQQVSVTTPTVNCLIPNNLSASNIQNTSVQVNWAGASADSFLVRYAVHNTTNFSWKKINGQPNVVSTALTGLTPGTQYDWWVRSLCVSIASSNYQAVPSTFTTLNTVAQCITPYNLNATSITNTSALVSWTNMVSADTFRVRYSINGTTNFIWKDVNGAGGNSTTLSGLTPATTYQFQVSSKCAGVSSAYSPSFVFSTLNTTAACIVPYVLSTTNITNASAVVNWTNLVVADTFRVRYSVNGTTNYLWKDVSGSGGTTNAALTGLAASTVYQWQARSVCTSMGSSSSYSSPVIFTTLAARIASENPAGLLHDVIIYPNPARSSATLQFNSDKDADATLALFDIAGREAQYGSFHMVEGKNGVELNLSNLTPGIYLVVVKSSDNSTARVNLIVE
ncbi:MAG: fibronectin type III domain-containing protein [Bacteroidetes bacterium]|nr:fibronectin type III domain-containing protein [Bacteroidota bacterium]